MNPWYSSLFTGIFTRFGDMGARPHDPDTALASGEAATWHAGNERITASGIGWTADGARGACVGEAVERLQAGPVPGDAVVHAAYGEWPGHEPAIDPSAWVLFHPEQYQQPGFPFRPLTRDSACDWVCFRQALTGLPYWIPAEIAYLHQRTPHRFCPGYSTGLAAGRSGEQILLRGLQEVIERDAGVGAWWGRYALGEVAFADVLASLDPEKAERVGRRNLSYRAFVVDSPFSKHVTIVTLEGEDREGYCFSIGAACRETRAASWEKSLLEAIHGRHYVRHLKAQIAAGVLVLGAVPTSFAEHAVYYSVYPERLKSTVFHKFSGTRSEPAGPESIHDLILRLGHERPVLFRSMTPPAFAAEGLDWRVLRVVVPGLQPLHGHHDFSHLGGPLWAPRGLGAWTDIAPHPFP